MRRRYLLLLSISLLLKLTAFTQAGKAGTIQLGRVDTIYSSILGETRTINVYLPQGYSPDSAKQYAVVYLLDGGVVDEDFIHIAGLIKYNFERTVNNFPEY